jgi:pimeloyl-ACP methyl ester carboxylesterase
VRVLFGRRDAAQDVRRLRGLRRHAPDSAIELVDASHWIVDERPDLVAERARALFALQ